MLKISYNNIAINSDSDININSSINNKIFDFPNEIFNFIINEKKELNSLTNISDKIKFINNFLYKFSLLIKNSNTSLVFVRKPKISINNFINYPFSEKITNLLGKRNIFDEKITGGNCHFWNIFYYEIFLNLFNDDKNIKINFIEEHDFHSFILLEIGDNKIIIDPTGINKTYKKLESNKAEIIGHFIININDLDYKNIGKFIGKKYNTINDYINEPKNSNIVSIGLNYKGNKYQFIIDNKNHTKNFDIVYLKNGKKQKYTYKVGEFDLNGNENYEDIFNIITKNMQIEKEDKEIIIYMLKKSNLKDIINIISNLQA